MTLMDNEMSDGIVFQKQCLTCKEVRNFSFFCKKKHGKYGLSSRCKLCDKLYYEKNSVKAKQKASQWRLNNQQKVLENKKSHYQKNSELYKSRARKWESENKIKHDELSYFYCARRRSHKKTCTPSWADVDAIKAIYAKASMMRKNGLDVEVDHIVPLVNKNVCGLHVQENLRIITKQENRKKSNQFLTEEI